MSDPTFRTWIRLSVNFATTLIFHTLKTIQHILRSVCLSTTRPFLPHFKCLLVTWMKDSSSAFAVGVLRVLRQQQVTPWWSFHRFFDGDLLLLTHSTAFRLLLQLQTGRNRQPTLRQNYTPPLSEANGTATDHSSYFSGWLGMTSTIDWPPIIGPTWDMTPLSPTHLPIHLSTPSCGFFKQPADYLATTYTHTITNFSCIP